MATQLLFYAQATPLNATAHRDLSVKLGNDYRFARQTNAVPLTSAEFPVAVHEYAIVFAGTDAALTPIVVLGAQQDQNLYLNADGTWNAHYIPAFVRRYPFVLAQSPEGKTLTLCIDEQFAGCNHEGHGERLFDADGERTAYLQQVLSFQQAYQAQHQRTREFCKRLVGLGLLQTVQAQLSAAGGARRVLNGLRVVDRHRLKALDAQAVHDLLHSDELDLIYLHLHSLNNLRLIGERLPATAATTTADSGPDSNSAVH
ncbi:MAG: multidrug transporter [Chromatiaceae bacterium]|nr:MAG: multidrug transporter [Chromatiaceae bacterium]